MNERARQRMPLHIFWSQPISSGPRHNDGLTAAGQWRMHALSVTTSDEKYTIVTRSRDRNKASLLAGTPASLPGTAQCLWPLPKALLGSRTPPSPSMHRLEQRGGEEPRQARSWCQHRPLEPPQA